jgi:hypothetical protein
MPDLPLDPFGPCLGSGCIGLTVYGAPRLGLDADGDAVALWTIPVQVTERPPSITNVVRVARRLGPGDWGLPVTLDDSAGAQADVALAGDGRAAAVWQDPLPPYGVTSTMHLALGEAGTLAWGAPEPLPALGLNPAVAINGRGDVLAAWTAAAPFVLQAAIRPAGGAWGPLLSAARSGASPPVLVMGEAGTGYVTWVGGPTVPGTILYAAAGTASGWAPPVAVVQPFTGRATLAAGPDRTALLLAWQLGTILAVSYDQAPTVRVATSVRGRWDPQTRAVRWTVRVRNTGRIAAQGVLVRIPTSGARLLASRPKAEPRPRQYFRWPIGKLAPGSSRSIVATIRPSGRAVGVASISVGVSAVAMPASWVKQQARVPSG